MGGKRQVRTCGSVYEVIKFSNLSEECAQTSFVEALQLNALHGTTTRRHAARTPDGGLNLLNVRRRDRDVSAQGVRRFRYTESYAYQSTMSAQLIPSSRDADLTIPQSRRSSSQRACPVW